MKTLTLPVKVEPCVGDFVQVHGGQENREKLQWARIGAMARDDGSLPVMTMYDGEEIFRLDYADGRTEWIGMNDLILCCDVTSPDGRVKWCASV